ncbi:MAG: ABC transporter ATP-binding protein [Dehalococcoidales bacterium]|nr:ABC transporter ATP-binding protein [Dehalococcoidales bacterium]
MIEVNDLSVDLGEFVLKNITLAIKEGEYFIILGPTGAGKTVLLESIAGLYPIKSGEIWLRGKEVTGVEPEKRKISIVYQDHVLFPHLSVRKNIVFGLKMNKVTAAEQDNRVNWVAELLGIGNLLHRKPDTLSGGEKQKVALARAIATRPELLLVDEPLSALDPETRETVQQELRRLHQALGITILHVTHDFEEAIALGSRIAVIGEGSLMQVGTPEEIFRHPNSEFVARFAMTRNVFLGKATKQSNGDTVFQVDGTEFVIAGETEGTYHASIRPEEILISTEPIRSSARNCFPGTITQIQDKGSTLYITVNAPPELSCLVTRHSFEELELRKGKRIYVTFKATSVHLFD